LHLHFPPFLGTQTENPEKRRRCSKNPDRSRPNRNPETQTDQTSLHSSHICSPNFTIQGDEAESEMEMSEAERERGAAGGERKKMEMR
jgi:hypothetical protein